MAWHTFNMWFSTRGCKIIFFMKSPNFSGVPFSPHPRFRCKYLKRFFVDILTLEDELDMFSRNVGNYLPNDAAKNPKRTKTTSTKGLKPIITSPVFIFVLKSGDVTDKTACKYGAHLYIEKTYNETARDGIFFFRSRQVPFNTGT
jgi:hypothetical protein